VPPGVAALRTTEQLLRQVRVVLWDRSTGTRQTAAVAAKTVKSEANIVTVFASGVCSVWWFDDVRCVVVANAPKLAVAQRPVGVGDEESTMQMAEGVRQVAVLLLGKTLEKTSRVRWCRVLLEKVDDCRYGTIVRIPAAPNKLLESVHDGHSFA